MRRLLLILLCLPLMASAAVFSVPGAQVMTFIGLSSDTKETIGNNSGAVWIESDTSRIYWWVGDKNSGSWVQADGPACEQNGLATSEGLCFGADGPWEFEVVGTSASDQSMGANGSTGDYLAYCIMSTSSTTATFQIEDGSNANFANVEILKTGAPIGVYRFDIDAQATTAAGWEITTTGTASGYCAGRFDTSGD